MIDARKLLCKLIIIEVHNLTLYRKQPKEIYCKDNGTRHAGWLEMLNAH